MGIVLDTLDHLEDHVDPMAAVVVAVVAVSTSAILDAEGRDPFLDRIIGFWMRPGCDKNDTDG